MPFWNIGNKLCEATTQIFWARNVEERHWFKQNGAAAVLHKAIEILSYHPRDLTLSAMSLAYMIEV